MPIRVILQIIPRGDESKTFTAGHLEIENDGTGSPGNGSGVGNYDLRIYGPVQDEPGFNLADEFWEEGRLQGFQRERGYWSCVKEALSTLKTDYDLTSKRREESA